VALSSLLGGIAIPLYTFGYSRLPSAGAQIAEGEPLPGSALKSLDGRDVSSAELDPAILMFFREDWCPPCLAQIQEVAEQYRALERRGVTVALISGQPQCETAKLADKADVPFLHRIDEGLEVARALGLFHEAALPAGLPSRICASGNSAYLPTVVVTGREGLVALNAQTDNYRVRPELATFLVALDAAGVIEPLTDEPNSPEGMSRG
jgi:peroxiredoxin